METDKLTLFQSLYILMIAGLCPGVSAIRNAVHLSVISVLSISAIYQCYLQRHFRHFNFVPVAWKYSFQNIMSKPFKQILLFIREMKPDSFWKNYF